MTYNYLWLVNRLCHKLGEVELTSSTFADADGVYNDFKESINAAILDIYHEEDTEWPFAWVETSFTTAIGTHEYNKHASATAVDWDSFYIKKAPLSITVLTQTAGVATATVPAGHQSVTGDRVYIGGVDQADYVGYFNITVLSATQFTFSVASTATSPATGTIIMYPAYTTKKLRYIDYDAYREERFLEQDGEQIAVGQYKKPERVVRKPDNNLILSSKPDRIYTIVYDYFALPTDLSDYNDAPVIPEGFKQCIVDGAIYHAYMFRDNLEEAQEAKAKYEKGVNSMRRILIPQTYYMRAVD